jgi:hypothetical protein
MNAGISTMPIYYIKDHRYPLESNPFSTKRSRIALSQAVGAAKGAFVARSSHCDLQQNAVGFAGWADDVAFVVHGTPYRFFVLMFPHMPPKGTFYQVGKMDAWQTD